MAKVASLVPAVLVLAGLFNNAVECFELVQLGRAFENNFQTSQLKLDIARLRLSRWGKSLGLDDNVQNRVSLEGPFSSVSNIQLAEKALGQIIELFADTERISIKYESATNPQDGSLAVYNPQIDLDPAIANLHEKLRQLAIERQNRSSIRQKAKWALYEKKYFRRLIANITELVDNLVELSPATQQSQRNLCDLEVSAIGEGEGRSVLEELAAAQDKLLEQAMTKARITTVFGDETTGLQMGVNSGSINTHFLLPGRPETPPQPSCFVPFRRDPDFVEHTTILDKIRERCSAPASRVALVGLGGVGKSQLAIEHCYRTAEQSPQTWVFWVHASDTARLEQSFRDIADQVKMRGRKDPQVDVFELLHDWLRDKKNGPWLLVIDDADDAAVLARLTDNNQSPAAKSSINGDNGGNILQQHLSRILPQSRHGSVLVTSRSKHVALKIVEDSEIMTVEPMQDAAAIELLCKKLGVQSSSDEEITELARVLDHMPLALVQAATYIRERAPRISVRQYLIGYQANDRTKISLLNKEAGHLRRDRAASNSVLMTWQLSFDHIKRVQNSAAELLSLMSFYDHQGIQESLLRSYSGAALKRKSEGIRKEDDRFEKDILTLRNYSFITVTEDPFTFEMPSLVQLATRKWLDNQGQLDYWRKQFIHNLCAELPTGEYENWTKCQALFPHARAALAQRPNNKDSLLEWALLLYKAAWYAWQRGRADDAEHMSTVSMEVRRKILGEEDAETLKSIEMVGQARFLRGKYEEAEGIVMHTLAQREKVLGREHPDTLASMNNLALVLDSQGKYKEAEEMMRQSWIRREKELGPTHPDTMTSRSNLAAVLDRQGNHKEAEAMNRATLLWLEKLLGPEHPSTLRAMGSLARGLNNQGKYNEAEEMMMQTLALVERVFEPEHPLTLEIVNSLEQVRLGQRLYEEAQKLKQRELEGCEELGPKQTEQTQIGSAGDSDLAQEDLLAMQNKRVGIEEINDNTQVPQFPPMEQHGENHIGATGDDSPSRQSFLAEQYKLSHTISSSLSRAFETSEKIFSSTGRDVQTVTEHTEHSQRGPSIPGYQSANSDEQTVPTGLYAAPTRYAPSEIDSQPGPKDRNCITELAAALFSKMTTSDVDIKTLQRISQLLPDLLRTFALKVGYQGPTQMHRDVMHFVYKYRMRVQGTFEDLFPLEEVKVSTDHSDFIMNRFMNDPEHAEVPLASHATEDPIVWAFQGDACGGADTFDHDAPDTKLYFDFIEQTPAYDWLVGSLSRETTLTRAVPDLMEDISAKILGALPTSHEEINRKTSPQEYKATFELLWNPLLFVSQQKYAEDPEEALERAITLTGAVDHAQAMTTHEYLRQVWPATGTHMMKLIADVARDVNHYASSRLPDGTTFEARINGDRFTAIIIGTGDSLAEAGQQLAWLGAALQSSPFKGGVALCSPRIRDCRLRKKTPTAEIYCLVEFDVRETDSNANETLGRCWHSMFRNPVMVNGFPIANNSNTGLGIEMPLNMMAELAGAAKAVEFQGKVVIKGFSTMLVATKLLGDMLVWHYLFNSNRDRISFLDIALEGTDDMSLLQLDNVRHVVGWSPDCMYNAGAPDAEYCIGRSGLPLPHSGAFLEKVTISGGRFLVAGATIAIGLKDVPLHHVRDSYISKLRWIDKKSVVLWDEQVKRGWLVNGTSALLHLVRMTLKTYSQGSFSSALLFKENKMKNATKHGPESAVEVLINDSNQVLEIWPGKHEVWHEEEVKTNASKEGRETSGSEKKKKGFTLFQDLVEQQYNTLELMIEHQKSLAGQNGVNLKLRARKHLEGWDFRDLANENDPRPRVATLQALGYGWVDFVRSIDAITLFGSGFGNIMQPGMVAGMCREWSQLPKGKYYLAVNLFDLKRIVEDCGNTTASGVEAVDGLIWHSPQHPFGPCNCKGHEANSKFKKFFSKRHDPVQVFCPKESTLFSKTQYYDLDNRGVVVFGHTKSWPYCWKGEERKFIEEESLACMPSEMFQQLQYTTAPQEVTTDPNCSDTSTTITDRSLKRHGSTNGGDMSCSSHSQSTPLTTPAGSIGRPIMDPLEEDRSKVDNETWQETLQEDDNVLRYSPTSQAAVEELRTNSLASARPASNAPSIRGDATFWSSLISIVIILVGWMIWNGE